MDEKKGAARDKMGRFNKGHSGGPGRGHKKEKQVELDGELLDMIEQVVRTGLEAKELKDRLKAAGIGIRVQSMRKPDDTGPVLEPGVGEWIGLLWNLSESYLNKTGIPISGLDLIKRMGEVCVNCDRPGTEAFEWKEIADDDL
jgi:hypothetical protein